LKVPWGYVGGIQLDPIEKKPFFHVSPGAQALSFGMLGCDFHCSYCQNWITSQALRDPHAEALPQSVTAKDIVALAKRGGAQVLTSTYNEPLITSEWAVEIFKLAKREGFTTSYVSNGNGTPEVLEFIRPYVDLYKIDLKGFRDKPYRELGGVLANITDTIERVYKMGFWLELVTLLIPGFNDSDDEIRDLCRFVAGVSPDIPWHATAFHPDYKMQGNGATPVSTLLRAAEIGTEAGLKYIYLGNRPGQVGQWENTRCPSCKKTLVARYGFHVMENKLEGGRCSCGTVIPGRWTL
jgi:pyruvate formate lyase activating enzyme